MARRENDYYPTPRWATAPSSELLCRRCRHYSHSCYLPCAMNPLGPTDGHCPDWEQVGPDALPTAGMLAPTPPTTFPEWLESSPDRLRVPGALRVLHDLVAFLVTP
jgi:hypothetical protein